jgi:hypothetical protein
MKYFALESVVNSFQRNVDSTESKFWGILGILFSVKEHIIPGRTYKFNTGITSQFLENLFCFKDKKDFSSVSTQYFVMFSKYWTEKVVEQMCSTTPNFYDVATWFFRNKAFTEEPSTTDLIQLFSQETGLSLEEIKVMFSFNERQLDFEEEKYSDISLLNKLNRLYKNEKGYHSITSKGEFIKANPGELSRAPFIQTLYASQQSTECLFITQFPIPEYYKSEASDNKPFRTRRVYC